MSNVFFPASCPQPAVDQPADEKNWEIMVVAEVQFIRSSPPVCTENLIRICLAAGIT